MLEFEQIKNEVIRLSTAYLPKLALAIVTLIVGFWLIGRIVKTVDKVLRKRNQDKTLRRFLQNILHILLKVILFISVASMIGIATASFIAVLGAAGLAVGLALQGSLSNFAGGVLIILFKPFKIGDLVELKGYTGTVKEIQIFNTVLTTLDAKTIILPNGPLSTSDIVNYSLEPEKRIDLAIGIGYDDDIEKARKVVLEVLDKEEKVLDSREKVIVVSNWGDSSVDLKVRLWTMTADYWEVYFSLYEKIKVAFDEADINIPYPHREVFLHNTN